LLHLVAQAMAILLLSLKHEWLAGEKSRIPKKLNGKKA
jgi:hypothetical protein